jgi:SAM-dependent methyltransferase
MNNKIKLHLGCGKRYLPDYTHVDIDNLPHIDYCTEIHNLSMFKDGSVDEIYNCGVIGYYDREDVILLLKEWNRVLKKEGVLRISVVDFKKQVQLYLKNENNLDTLGVLGPLFGKWKYTNNKGEQGVLYKKTAYDYKSLEQLLTKNNFKDCKKYSWEEFLPYGYDDYSAAYVPHMDKNGVHIMLNMECKKC